MRESDASLFLAGAEGFEPPSPVLETGSLTVELTPLNSALRHSLSAFRKPFWRIANSERRGASFLLRFLVRRVLAARPAELLELQPARRGLLVLGGGVIAVLAITALQSNNLSRH